MAKPLELFAHHLMFCTHHSMITPRNSQSPKGNCLTPPLLSNCPSLQAAQALWDLPFAYLLFPELNLSCCLTSPVFSCLFFFHHPCSKNVSSEFIFFLGPKALCSFTTMMGCQAGTLLLVTLCAQVRSWCFHSKSSFWAPVWPCYSIKAILMSPREPAPLPRWMDNQ